MNIISFEFVLILCSMYYIMFCSKQTIKCFFKFFFFFTKHRCKLLRTISKQYRENNRCPVLHTSDGWVYQIERI